MAYCGCQLSIAFKPVGNDISLDSGFGMLCTASSFEQARYCIFWIMYQILTQFRLRNNRVP